MASGEREKRARVLLKVIEGGAKDRRNGVDRSDCPYRHQTLHAALWRSGWVYGARLIGEEATE